MMWINLKRINEFPLYDNKDDDIICKVSLMNHQKNMIRNFKQPQIIT